MKRVSSFIIAIITLISLTVPAFADSSDYISDPDLRAEYQRQMEELEKYSYGDENNQIIKDLAVAVRNLDIDESLQHKRIEERNGKEALNMFINKWIPLEEKYFSSFDIQDHCDFYFKAGD